MKLTKIDIIKAELEAEEAYPSKWVRRTPSSVVRRALDHALLFDDGEISEIGETVRDIVCRMEYDDLGRFLRAMGLDNVSMAVGALVDLIQEVCKEEK